MSELLYFAVLNKISNSSVPANCRGYGRAGNTIYLNYTNNVNTSKMFGGGGGYCDGGNDQNRGGIGAGGGAGNTGGDGICIIQYYWYDVE